MEREADINGAEMLSHASTKTASISEFSLDYIFFHMHKDMIRVTFRTFFIPFGKINNIASLIWELCVEILI